MRILFLGDVMGRTGRRAVAEHLGPLKAELRADFVIVNAENATSGVGLSGAHAKAILEAGADCLTLGDHAFDQRDMLQFIATEPRILRPINYASDAPGQGARVFEAAGGRKILVAQVLGQVFMKRPFDNPFSALDALFAKYKPGGLTQAALIDIHAEATSEKMAIGHFADGKASAVIGSHTHVPTADAMILPGGTAYQTDAGMCGDYNSVIGMDRAEPLRRFVTGMSRERFSPARGEATICGALIQTEDRTGRAQSIAPVRRGGVLAVSCPG